MEKRPERESHGPDESYVGGCARPVRRGRKGQTSELDCELMTACFSLSTDPARTCWPPLVSTWQI